jgi:hypothetical protein
MIEDKYLGLERQGKTSGWDSGDITHTDPDTNEFRINVTSDVGDSGGPVYNNNGGDGNLMGGITTRSWTDQTVVFAAERIEDELNVVI